MNPTDPAGVIPRLRRNMSELAQASRDHAREQHEELRQPSVFERTPSLLSELQELGGRISTLGWNIRSAAMCAEQARAEASIEELQRQALDLGQYAHQAASLSQSLSRVVEHEAERRGRSQS